MQPISSEADLDALHRASQAYAVISAWSAAGLFDALASGPPRTAAELPADSRAIEITAPILAHLGLLAGDGQRWALSLTGHRLLESGALSLASAADNLGDLSRLDAVMANGGPVRGPDGESQETEIGVCTADPEASHRFMAFLHRRSGDSAAEVVRWLQPRLSAGACVLDLGGGHGRYGQALSAQGFGVTLFDLPVCIEYAHKHHGSALNYIAGDFWCDDLGGPYDAILASNIVHGLGADENERLLHRLEAALKPGGILLLKDMFLDDSQIGPENAVCFGLTMLLYTQRGRSYSVQEMNALCVKIGLGAVEHVRMADGGFSLLFSRKPR